MLRRVSSRGHCLFFAEKDIDAEPLGDCDTQCFEQIASDSFEWMNNNVHHTHR